MFVTLPLVLFNEWTHDSLRIWTRVTSRKDALLYVFRMHSRARSVQVLGGGKRNYGRENTAWRGKGHDRIGSLGNAASKWRQPTWRSVVKHRPRHKMQWPTGIFVGPRGNIWSYMPRVQGLRATVWWMSDRIHRQSFFLSVTSRRWEMTDVEVIWLGYLDLRQT